MENIFGIIVVICGIYCLYGFYLVKVKRELPRGVFLPKGIDVKKCKDLEGYCKGVQGPLLILGIVALAQGAADMYNTSVGGIDSVYFALFIIFVIILVWFAARVKKMNREYFGI